MQVGFVTYHYINLSDAKTHRERKHVEAAKSALSGHWRKAAIVWEDILVDYPSGMLICLFN
jgi:hypothetical protein